MFLYTFEACLRMRRRRMEGVNGIEKQLECAVRLRAKRDLRPEEDNFSLADRGFDHCRQILQPLFTPGPAASQTVLRIKPQYGSHTLLVRSLTQAEGRILVKKHVHA